MKRRGFLRYTFIGFCAFIFGCSIKTEHQKEKLPKTMEDSSKFIVNVKENGAKGDGVTDDTLAIQSAIDLVSKRGGGNVYFPAGVYIIQPKEAPIEGGALVITSNNISLIGENVKNTKLLYKALNGENPAVSENVSGALYFKNPDNMGIHNIEIRSLDIDGNVPDAYTARRNLKHKGLYFANDGGASSDIRIYDCYVHNFRGELLYNGGYDSGLLLCKDSTFEQSSGSIAAWGGRPEYYNCRFLYGKDAGVEQSVPPNGRLVVKDCYFKNCCSTAGTQLSVMQQSITDNTDISCEIVGNYFEHTLGLGYFSSVTVVSFGRAIIKGNKFKDAGTGGEFGHACVRLVNVPSNFPNSINDNVVIEDNDFIADETDILAIKISGVKPDKRDYVVNTLTIKNNRVYSSEKAIAHGKTATFASNENVPIKTFNVLGNSHDIYSGKSMSIPSTMENVSNFTTFSGVKQIEVIVNLPYRGNCKVEIMQTKLETNVVTNVLDLTGVKGEHLSIETIRVDDTSQEISIRAASSVRGAKISYKVKE